MDSPAPKRVIRRRRRSDPNDPEAEKRRKARHYFDDTTRDGMLRWRELRAQGKHREAGAVYLTSIHPAFEKLAENQINIMKIVGHLSSFEEVKADCVEFLVRTIDKWDETRATAPFSYFNMCARNFLINVAKKRKHATTTQFSIEAMSEGYVEVSPVSSLFTCEQAERPDLALLRAERNIEVMRAFQGVDEELETQSERYSSATDAKLVMEAVRKLYGRDEDELRDPDISLDRKLTAPQMFPLLSAMTGITDSSRLNRALGVMRRAWRETKG
jgi:hypothetical protein